MKIIKLLACASITLMAFGANSSAGDLMKSSSNIIKNHSSLQIVKKKKSSTKKKYLKLKKKSTKKKSSISIKKSYSSKKNAKSNKGKQKKYSWMLPNGGFSISHDTLKNASSAELQAFKDYTRDTFSGSTNVMIGDTVVKGDASAFKQREMEKRETLVDREDAENIINTMEKLKALRFFSEKLNESIPQNSENTKSFTISVHKITNEMLEGFKLKTEALKKEIADYKQKYLNTASSKQKLKGLLKSSKDYSITEFDLIGVEINEGFNNYAILNYTSNDEKFSLMSKSELKTNIDGVKAYIEAVNSIVTISNSVLDSIGKIEFHY